jgi:competence protein ComEC
MRFKEYPILKLLLGFIIGIIIAESKFISLISVYWLIFPLIIIAFLAWPKKFIFTYKYQYLSGTFIILFYILLGIISFQYHFENKQSNYFGGINKSANYFQLRIIEPPLEKPNSVKIFAEVQAASVNNTVKNTVGKVLVYVQKDSNALKLEYNDEILVRNNFSFIEAPKNPDQFNYKEFLALKDLQYQAYFRANEWSKLKIATFGGVKYYALKLRSHLINILEKNEVKGDELGIAAGMLLGVRDMLSPELRQAYAGAGAMHILCVSGLHVGIILLMMNVLLSFLNYKSQGRIFKAVIILSVIWFYAFLTGLSPSVVRAATMFSFVTIGQNINRHTNIFSSLSASALVLLLYNPSMLFELGFQLSYSAVVAIVILQKPLANLWTPNNTILFNIWQLITVSIAAQIGTAPLSLYYFHQFPNLFIITNLIVIPAAYIIIFLGIAVLLFSLIPYISLILGKLLSLFLALINYLIIGIEHLPFAVSDNLFIDDRMLVLMIVFVITMSIWLILRQKRLIFLNLSLLALIVLANIFKYNLDDELILYHSKKNMYLAVYSNREAFIICDSVVYKDPTIMNFQTREHELSKGIIKRNYVSLSSLEDYKSNNVSFHYPFLKFNETIVTINERMDKFNSIISSDYIILLKTWRYDYELKDLNKPLILSANIPRWKQSEITNSIGKNTEIYSVKEKGSWVM